MASTAQAPGLASRLGHISITWPKPRFRSRPRGTAGPGGYSRPRRPKLLTTATSTACHASGTPFAARSARMCSTRTAGSPWQKSGAASAGSLRQPHRSNLSSSTPCVRSHARRQPTAWRPGPRVIRRSSSTGTGSDGRYSVRPGPPAQNSACSTASRASRATGAWPLVITGRIPMAYKRSVRYGRADTGQSGRPSGSPAAPASSSGFPVRLSSAARRPASTGTWSL